ncbi:MAG: RNA-binding protein [Clostridiales bacterium GWE2_32_10]|nr:MAG: RNA-binding protein [Clostridiales bacterium GWE2_32_10]
MEKIYINTESIKLGQLLKLAGIVSSGIEAKILITNGKVKVNNEIVCERGRKIYKGYIIETEGGEKILVDTD